jgi:glycosyltransferase involved in cell wall biosynthesis
MAQSCDRIARGLRACGIDLDVVHFTRRAQQLHVEHQHGGRLVRCPVDEDVSHALNVLWTGWARHVSNRTHLVAFGGLVPVLAAPVFAAWMDVPLLTLLRGNDFDTGLFSLRRGWALREALTASTMVCTVSADHAKKIGRLFPRTRVEVVPNGIDLADWTILESDAARGRQLREELRADDRRILGIFGHLKRKKGVSLLLDAIARSNAADRLHILLVGEIDNDVEKKLDELGVSPRSTRMPFLDRWELLPCFAACDLVAIPSIYDGMPNILLEAAALGVPVLASNAGGLGDVLRDGVNAIVFEAGDVHDARRAVETAASIPVEQLRLFAERLSDTVRRELTADREIDRYVGILERIAEPTAAHAGSEHQLATETGDSN